MNTSNTLPCPPRTWTTSSYGDTTDTTPMELDALREHVAQCSRNGGRLSVLAGGMQKVKGFVAGRVMTSLALVAALAGVVTSFF